MFEQRGHIMLDLFELIEMQVRVNNGKSVAGAGLFVTSLRNVRGVRIGYDIDPVLVVYFEQRGTKLDADERLAFWRR